MTQKPPPDIEALIIAYLKADAGLVALAPGGIGTELDPTVAAVTSPAIQLTLVNTITATHRHLYGHLLQLTTWAPSKPAAFDAAAAANARLLDELVIVGVHGTLGVVTGVENVTGPRWNPEPEIGTPRYLNDVRVYARAV